VAFDTGALPLSQPGERPLHRASEYSGIQSIADRPENRPVEQVLPESDPIDADGLPASLRIQARIVRHGTARSGRAPAPEVRAYRPTAGAASSKPDKQVGGLVFVAGAPHELAIRPTREDRRPSIESLFHPLPEVL
jgi:hypothetical protein